MRPSVVAGALLCSLVLLPSLVQAQAPEGMVLVPAGEFVMGSTEADLDAAVSLCGGSCQRGWFANETPAHVVYLDAFYIDAHPVTNLQYEKYNPAARDERNPHSNCDACPVTRVAWEEAQRYCAHLGKRLPTEAEWEKAARGMDGRQYPWGNAPPGAEHCNFGRQVGHASAVGSYPDGVSPYGAHDLAGNMWEWVADWYDEAYYRTSPRRNPKGPAEGTDKVVRGGAWNYDADYVRSALRLFYDPTCRGFYVGFRCAKDAR